MFNLLLDGSSEKRMLECDRIRKSTFNRQISNFNCRPKNETFLPSTVSRRSMKAKNV